MKKRVIILIIVILTLLIAGIAIILKINQNKKIENTQTKEQYEKTEIELENIVEELEAKEEFVENTNKSEKVENTVQEEMIKNQISTPKNTDKNTPNEKQGVDVENKKNTNVQEVKPKDESPTNTENSNKPTKPSESDKEQTTEVPPIKDETKYVKNETMINKIKQTIQANETADMKTYGYNIVVDSSIKNLTNQFTFTENRVKNNIRYSFGTIKIYAEDYYKNGSLVMTQCYIL